MLKLAVHPKKIAFTALFFAAILAMAVFGLVVHGGGNADLTAFSTGVGPLNQPFQSSVTNYTAEVNGNIDTADLSAAADPAATVQINFLSATPGSKLTTVIKAVGSASCQVNLATGVNTITVVVTSSDKSTTKKYTILLKRLPDLKGLTVSGGALNPEFFILDYDYKVDVPYGVKSVTLTPDANDDAVTQITIDGKAVQTNTAYTVNLSVGKKTVIIHTQTPDGSATCTYTITITRYDSTWQQVGGTINTNGGTMLLSSIGEYNYTAYYDNNANGIVVKRFDGVSWATVGSPIEAYGNQFALYDCGGTPWLTYMDSVKQNLMHVCSFDGTDWTDGYQVDITHYSKNKGAYFVFGGKLYVAYSDPNASWKLSVLRYEPASSAFVAVGNSGFSTGAADMISLYVDANTAYVAYCDTAFSNKANVMKLVGKTWVQVGAGGVSKQQAQKIMLVVDNGTPWLDYYQKDQGYVATVVKFDGSKWAQVGTPQTTFNTSYGYFTVGAGVPYLAYQDLGYKPTVIDYDGTSWQTLAYPCFTSDQSFLEGIATLGGTPYVLSNNLVYSCVPADSTDLTGLSFSGSAGIINMLVNSSSSDVSLDVPGYFSSVRIKGYAKNSRATISVNGNGAYADVTLKVGINDITVAVKSQDGTQTKTYKIHLNRLPDNYLTNLSVNGYTLSPVFDKNTTSYKLEVKGYTDVISIKPILSDSASGGATVTVDGKKATSGSYSQVIIGAKSRVIDIVVTARDGSSVRKYSIDVHKQSMTYQQVGGNIPIASSDDFGSAKLAVCDGVVYAGYLQYNTNPATIVVKRYNGKGWVQLGAGLSGMIENLDSQWLQVSNDVPYVMCQDKKGEFFIKRFNGATWETVCKASDAGFPKNDVWGPISFTVDNGIPYIAYAISTYDVNAQGNSIPVYFEGVYKYVGNAWVKLGKNSLNKTSGANVDNPIIKVYHGVPYVAYTRDSTGYIVDLVNGSWTTVGSVNAAPIDFVMDSSTGACFLMYSGYVVEFAHGHVGQVYSYLDGTATKGQLAASGGKAYVFCSISTNNQNENLEVLGDDGWVYISNPGILSMNYDPFLASEDGKPYLITEVLSGTKRVLSVSKFEPSNEATLCGICVNGFPVVSAFNPSQKSYTAYVADTITSAMVSSIPSDKYAAVQINGSASPCSVSLQSGANVVTITTKSLDGTATAAYTLTIIRAAASDSTLQALNVYGGDSSLSVSPAFASAVLSYKVTTPYTVSSVTLVAPAKNPLATITGAGVKTLQYGLNTFTITVKSHDGKSTTSYKVAVTRAYPAKPNVTLLTTVPTQFYGFTPGGTNRLAIKASLVTPVPATYKATVYNSKGKIVAVFTLSNQSSGDKAVTWDGKATTGNTAGLRVGVLVPVSSAGTAYTIKISAQNIGGTFTTAGYAIKLYNNPVISGFSVSPLKMQIDPLFGQSYITVGFKVNHMSNAEVRFITSHGTYIVKISGLVPNKTYYAKWNGYINDIPVANTGSPAKVKIQISAGNTTYKPSTVVTLTWTNPVD